MNATKYQIFLKTVECGSFTKAAADLNFSQSGISHAINSLEEELGDCLFSLLCLSQCLGLEGEAALGKALEKYEKRFAERGTIGHRT